MRSLPGRGPRVALLLLLPTLALCAVTGRALDYAFTWTDGTAIAGGTMLRPPGEVWQAFREPLHRVSGRGDSVRQPYYRPLQVVLLSTVDHLAGREPRAFRIATLAVASLAAGVFGLVAYALLGGTPAAFGAALWAAVWVALHPVNIESTVWIAGVSGPLCSLFVLAALGLARASVRAPARTGAVCWGALSTLALLVGLLAKERAGVEPALLVAGLASFGLAPGCSRTHRPPQSGPAPWLVRGGALVAVHAGLVAVYVSVWRPIVLGGALPGLPPLEGSRAVQAWSALASWPASLGWLFAPVVSSTNDAVRIVRTAADPGVWLGAALAVGSLLAWWRLARGGRPAAALGLAWIWIAFLPTSGLLPMLHLRGERYLYLSCFGAALLLADLAPALWRRLLPGRRALGLAVAVAACLGVAACTLVRLPDWESNEVLFRRELAHDPDYREGAFLLATELSLHGRFDEADRVLAPLLAPRSGPAERAGYLNRLSLFELACANTRALGRHQAVVELEERAGPAVASVPSFRTCVALSKVALGRQQEALDDFLAVAQALGAATPPRIALEIARAYARLRHRAEARAWLERAAAGAAADPALQRDVARLRRQIAPR